MSAPGGSETPGYLPPAVVLARPLGAGPTLAPAYSGFWAATYAHEALRRGVSLAAVTHLSRAAAKQGRGLLARGFARQIASWRALADDPLVRAHPWLIELVLAAPGALSGPEDWKLLARFLSRIAVLMAADRALARATALEPPAPPPPKGM